MTGRILIFIVCIFVLSVNAQQANSVSNGKNPATSTPQSEDQLIKHLSAAESYQVTGDLYNAAIENRAVLGIALARFGFIAIEEGKYSDAVDFLSESLKYSDNASNRTNLAIAFLRQNLSEKALVEAQIAVSIDPTHIGAHYILGNIHYANENYKAALPHLKKAYSQTPDLELARALGLTFLNLKQPELAQQHFEEMLALAGKESVGLYVLFAKFYERTNYPADAERELLRALAIEPETPKVNLYLGYLLLQHGGSERLEDAGAAFERELKLSPGDFYSLFFSGVVASALNDHLNAIPFLRKAVEINPESGEAHLFLGQSQIELNELVDAEKNLRRAVELESKGGKNTQARRTHFMLGRLLLKTGKKEEAQKELAIAGELQKAALDSSRNEINRILGQVAEGSDLKSVDDQKVRANIEIKIPAERALQLNRIKTFLDDVIAQAFYNLGVISTQNSNLNEAIDNFSYAYRFKPDFPNLNRNLGIVSFRANEFQKAIDPLSRHLEKNPGDILMIKMLGSSYYFTMDFKNSIKTLKAIETNISEDAELAYFYGISLIQSKRNQEAILIFDQLSKTAKQKPEGLFYAAQGFMMAGNYGRAIKEFERVVVLAPEMQRANYFIGQCFLRLNRPTDAERSFGRELEINPGDAGAKYHLALTLIERKIEADRAIRLLKEAVDLRNGYADAHYQLGKIYLERNETQNAITELELAVSADPNKDYIHYQLSIAYRKMSRKTDADRELKLYQKLKEAQRNLDTPAPMGEINNSQF